MLRLVRITKLAKPWNFLRFRHTEQPRGIPTKKADAAAVKVGEASTLHVLAFEISPGSRPWRRPDEPKHW